MAIDPKRQPTYLGDGVYAEFDGYQIWIWTGEPERRKSEIALDSDTIHSLNAYVERIRNMPVENLPEPPTFIITPMNLEDL